MSNIEPVKGSATVIIDDLFTYEQLDKQDSDFLKEKAAYINARRHITHTLITEMGKALIEAKERLPGVFLRWARSEFGFSDDSLENYMNVARRMPALPDDQPGNIQARALYLLTRESTPATARIEAQELAGQGVTVDYNTAFILANAPVEIKTRYLSEELPKQTAYDLTRVLSKKTLSPEVKAVCLQQGVTSPELVEYLDKAHSDYIRTKGTQRERSTWIDIESDGWQLNGVGWSVPIGQARPVDIDRFKVDRSAMHKDFAPQRWEWVVTDVPLQETSDGRLILILDNPALQNMAAGEYVRLQIRTPKESDDE